MVNWLIQQRKTTSISSDSSVDKPSAEMNKEPSPWTDFTPNWTLYEIIKVSFGI